MGRPMLEDTPDGELNKRRASLREMGQAKRRKERMVYREATKPTNKIL